MENDKSKRDFSLFLRVFQNIPFKYMTFYTRYCLDGVCINMFDFKVVYLYEMHQYNCLTLNAQYFM